MDAGLIYRYKARRLLFSAVLALLTTSVHSQMRSEPDTLIQINLRDYYILRENLMNFGINWPADIPNKLIPPSLSDNDRNPLFFDSLNVKASKYLITKKLYDFVVVSNKPSTSNQITGSSEDDYVNYSGKIIRKIEIKRLNVFGTDINNPLVQPSGKMVNILNKTHTNTIERIIRKNLLFTEGDTLSPILLSDNERILRQLPYIDDSRIIVISDSDGYVDILVVTKDVYSLGGSFDFKSVSKGAVSVFDKNIFGAGHEMRLRMPYDADSTGSPGFGVSYNINNISRSFINLNVYYQDALGKRTYGVGIDRQLVSSATRYAGGIFIKQTLTTEDLDTLPEPEPLKFNYQDYWLSRSFLLNREKVTRLIIGGRYINNNVFAHPYILPDSYYSLQRYKLFLASAALSVRKYYKANLIYGYGRTEDIPYGGMIDITAGREINEFKQRYYTGIRFSLGDKVRSAGYLYGTAGFSTFFSESNTEQGTFFLRADYFTNLLYIGTHRMRNFIRADYTRGFGRYTDECLLFNNADVFTGFRNDSLRAEKQRLTVNLESVLFSPRKLYGFRFAFFAFGDLGYLFGTNEFFNEGEILSRIGIGLRLRNDNLVFNTLQIKFSFYPNLPLYSKVSNFNVSGERLLDRDNFEPGPPSLLPYR